MPRITRAELQIISAECVRIRQKVDEITRRDAAAGALAAEVLPQVDVIERHLTAIDNDPTPEELPIFKVKGFTEPAPGHIALVEAATEAQAFTALQAHATAVGQVGVTRQNQWRTEEAPRPFVQIVHR